MDYYYDSILKAVNLIENNLTKELTLSDIVKETGFSKYHFIRIFKSITGSTVKEYVRKRKITKAAHELIETDKSIIDIALSYGYNSQEAFTRAFKEMYGVTPHMYRKNKIHFNNIHKMIISKKVLDLKEGNYKMKPTYVEKKEFIIVGMKYEGKNENGEISKLWSKFAPRIKEIENRVNENVCYGFETYDERMEETGEFTYVTGIEVSSIDNIPEGMVYYKVPHNKYAVFTISSIIENIPKSICEIYGKWLREYGLKPADNYDFEYYNEDFIPNDENSKLYFYIPIEKTNKNEA